MNKTSFRLDALESPDRYKLLSGLIVPRPIGWIGTRRSDGSNNLAPFSFFNLVSSSPPTVLFSGGRHPDRPKDTVALAGETGVFTVNIVSEEVAQAMAVTSERYEADVDEFAIAGLTAVPGTVVDAPMVEESPANLECRVVEIVDLGDQGVSRLVIGEVIALHVSDEVLDGTRIDNDGLRAVGRMAGNTYIHTRDRFALP
ncbi:MAG: flavin reductase family protein [Actinobacteria bacterium]|nr:flavin reductase family protein [Actinomycetota bacterium]